MLLLLCTTYSLWSAAQYKPDDNKSLVKFKIKNFGINTGGTFSGLKGTILFDPASPEKTVFTISISAASVNTGNDLRDNHLRNKDYFDAEHYPEICFQSTKISRPEKNGMLNVAGKLTMKNHSKEISFPFTAETIANGYLFKGMFSINRKDFEIGGPSIIADNAEVTLEVTAVK